MAHWDVVTEAMVEVVHGAAGSAKSIARGAQYKIAGKTGTAQVISIAQDESYDEEKISRRKWDHAWFVGFAPAENPGIVVATIIENGGKSSLAAAVVRKVLDAYLLDQGMLQQASAKQAASDNPAPTQLALESATRRPATTGELQ